MIFHQQGDKTCWAMWGVSWKEIYIYIHIHVIEFFGLQQIDLIKNIWWPESFKLVFKVNFPTHHPPSKTPQHLHLAETGFRDSSFGARGQQKTKKQRSFILQLNIIKNHKHWLSQQNSYRNAASVGTQEPALTCNEPQTSGPQIFVSRNVRSDNIPISWISYGKATSPSWSLN